MTKLTYPAAAVFGYLFPQMNCYGTAIPSVDTIAQKCDLTQTQVTAAVIELIQNNYITSKIEPTKNPHTGHIVNWTNYRLAF
jgi:DNA-binding MarR family transcriptional regulator